VLPLQRLFPGGVDQQPKSHAKRGALSRPPPESEPRGGRAPTHSPVTVAKQKPHVRPEE
jgi:hypothetical protein